MPIKSATTADGDYELRQPANQLEALGEAALISEYTQLYGRMPMATFAQRFMACAVNNQIYMLYQKAPNVPDVVVGFVLIGELTPQIGRLYEARNRELMADEVAGGEELWALDLATPFGHYTIIKDLIHKIYPNATTLWGLRKGKRTSFPPKTAKTPETEASSTLAPEQTAIPVVIQE